MANSDPHKPVLCFGEIVWDALPSGLFLGGAPLNVAFHLSQLNIPALPVSRIGHDFLGSEVQRRLKMSGLRADLVQYDQNLPTGVVLVELNEAGNADYDILQPAAWDSIAADPRLLEVAESAGALVYGSLATRSPQNCEVLEELIRRVPVRLCDVNLRKPFDQPANALHWASKATIVKLNEDELKVLSPAANTDSIEAFARALQEQISVETLVVTCGGDGAHVLHRGKWASGEAVSVKVADTVGAGDAFTAAFLANRIKGKSVEVALQAALKLGAYVASQPGAQPLHSRVEGVGSGA